MKALTDYILKFGNLNKEQTDFIASQATRLTLPKGEISLNFNNPELQKILHWAGTHHEGAKGFIDTFAGVNEFWTIQTFEVQDIFSEDEKAAVFGSFTYPSRTLNKQVTSPFSILAKVKERFITLCSWKTLLQRLAVSELLQPVRSTVTQKELNSDYR